MDYPAAEPPGTQGVETWEEYQRGVQLIRGEFEERTWEAFWRMAVDGRTAVEVAAELRDALRRRQKELPARWLAAFDAATLRAGERDLPAHPHETTERELGLALLRDTLPNALPRGVVCIHPSASSVNLALADALCQRGSVASIAAAELDPKLAVEMLERVASRGSR